MADDIENLHYKKYAESHGLNKELDYKGKFKDNALIQAAGGKEFRPISQSILTTALYPKGVLASDTGRPLIDHLQEATFTDRTPMQWVTDKYSMRMLLRKAHCFTVDKVTSGLITEFSIAIAGDIDDARQLAVPPFPTTWFEIDNIARLNAAKRMQIRLAPTAMGQTEAGDAVPRVGWFITTIGPDEYACTYACHLAEGMFVAPVSFCWTTKREPVNHVQARSKEWLDRMLFGCTTNCNIDGAWLGHPSFMRSIRDPDGVIAINEHELELMKEISGELRHVFGLLIALGAGQMGAVSSTTVQAPPSGAPPVMKGKPLLPLEHKVLTIKLSRRMTVAKVAAKAISGNKKRWHEVRGHFRKLVNADGSLKRMTPVKPHHRGDEKVGRIEKTYLVER